MRSSPLSRAVRMAVGPVAAVPLALALAAPAAAATPPAPPVRPAAATQPAPAHVSGKAAAAQRAAQLRKARVIEVQFRLTWLGLYAGPKNGIFTPATAVAVRRFQEKYGLAYYALPGPRAMGLLRWVTRRGDAIDPRCRRPGRVLCVDKTMKIVRALQGARIVQQTDARFGRSGLQTREGVHSVYRKSVSHRSSLVNAIMPYSMFFSRGQAVHFSRDFARHGYNGGSHGCINIRNMLAVRRLFGWAPLGTPVVVYRS